MEPNLELYCVTDPGNPAVTNVTIINGSAVQHGSIPTGRLYDWLKTNANFKTAASGERATGTRG